MGLYFPQCKITRSPGVCGPPTHPLLVVGVQSLLSQVLPLAFVSALSAAYVARAVPAAGLAILGLQAHAINDDWRLRCQGEAGAVATVGWLFVQGLLGSLALLGRGGRSSIIHKML